MLARIHSAATLGIDARVLDVEVDVSYGLPRFTIVGLPDASVREARERVRSALRNSGFPDAVGRRHRQPRARRLPEVRGRSRPAGRRRPSWRSRGSSPRTRAGGSSSESSASTAQVRPDPRRALPRARRARRGLRRDRPARGQRRRSRGGRRDPGHPGPVALPPTVEHLRGTPADRALRAPRGPDAGVRERADFADVRGQAVARRALEIAAAGGHHVLLVGPPGAGKTMLARRLPSILPPADAAPKSIEVTRIHSVAGTLPAGARPRRRRRPSGLPTTGSRRRASLGGGRAPGPGGDLARAPRSALSRRAARVPARRPRGDPPADRGEARLDRPRRRSAAPSRATSSSSPR